MKKDEPDSSGGCGSSVNPCTTPQDGPVVGEEAVKTEVAAPVDEPEIKSPSVVGDVKPETASVASVPDTAGTLSVGTACVPAVSAVVVEAQATVKEESPQKSLRKTGKRKRRFVLHSGIIFIIFCSILICVCPAVSFATLT